MPPKCQVSGSTSSVPEQSSTCEQNNTADTTVLSSIPSSTSTLNLGFLDDASSLLDNDVPQGIEELVSKIPSFELANTPTFPITPTTPPEELDISSEYHTPAPSLSPSSSQEKGKATIKTKPKNLDLKAKRLLDLLAIDVESLSDSATLVSGEVDSGPNTPTPQAEACPALGVSMPDATAYLVKATSGQVPVDRIRPEAVSESPCILPSQADLPSTASEARELRTKIKVRSSRQRGSSSNPNYPTERVVKAKTLRENRDSSQESGSEAPPTARPSSSKHNVRGTDGRFLKK